MCFSAPITAMNYLVLLLLLVHRDFSVCARLCVCVCWAGVGGSDPPIETQWSGAVCVFVSGVRREVCCIWHLCPQRV